MQMELLRMHKHGELLRHQVYKYTAASKGAWIMHWNSISAFAHQLIACSSFIQTHLSGYP